MVVRRRFINSELPRFVHYRADWNTVRCNDQISETQSSGHRHPRM
jgi:hypothetical protein